MLIPILVAAVAACAFGVAASIVMARASNRSGLWNMLFGGVLALALMAGALMIAYLLTRAVYPG